MRSQGTQTQHLTSIANAAEQTGLSAKTIRRYIAEGRLPAYRLGPRMIRVDLDDIDRLWQPLPASDAEAG